jgi:hypothetical protein
MNGVRLGGGVGAHYWAGKEFRREGVLHGARSWRVLQPSVVTVYRLAALVLLLTLTSLALYLKSSQLKQELNAPRGDVDLVELFADSVRRGGPEPEPLALPASAGSLLFILHFPEDLQVYPSYQRYDVALSDARTERMLWEGHDLPPRRYRTFNVEVRRSSLREGVYVFRLYGVQGAERLPLASYRFQLPRQNSPRRLVLLCQKSSQVPGPYGSLVPWQSPHGRKRSGLRLTWSA